MTPDEFVEAFYIEYLSLVKMYFGNNGKNEVADMIKSLHLDNKGADLLQNIIGGVLRDAFYKILLAIDGEANIGGRQIAYKLFDEENNELTGGEIERFAWEYFHNSKAIIAGK